MPNDISMPETSKPLMDETDVFDLLNKSAEKNEEKSDDERVEKAIDLPDGDESEEKEDDKEEEIKIADEDDEKEEIKEEDDELIDPPFKKKEILAKYPGIFKDFPGVERSIYREKAYAEVFPTVQDAKEASERVEILKSFEEQVFSGNINAVLAEVKDKQPEVYNDVVENYLPNLYKLDPVAYTHVMNKVVDNMVNHLWQKGSKLDNEEMKAAAKMLYAEAFGDTDYKPVGKFGGEREKSPEIDKIRKEKEDFERERFETVKTELKTRVDNTVKSTIDRNIDPKSQMSDYIKKNATKDCMSKVEEIISGDSRFKSVLETLWKRAAENKYKPEYVQKIRNAYLNKAKTVLPDVIRSVRNDALKGITKQISRDTEERSSKRLPVGRSATTNGRSDKNKYDGGDVFGFLNRNQ